MINSYLEYISAVSKLAECSRIYHTGGQSPLTDAEFDQLRKDIITWEAANPDRTLELTPTQQVGYIEPENIKETQRHEYPMLSLENALDIDEAESWIQAWVAKYGPDVKVIGEFKYDGVALSLTYIDGVFVRALTRGNGEYGEDVTIHAARFVKERIDAQGTVEVRGEAIVKKAWLEFINSGDQTYANSRSAVIGLLGRDEPNDYTNGISFVPYDLEGPDFVFTAYLDKLETLKNLGFSMHSCFILKPSGIHEVFEVIAKEREKDAIPFEIDGMVFKLNDEALQHELGETSHSPRWAFAYKFPPVKGECTVVGVEFQVGRSGEIAPVAKITATPLMGVVVTSVNLHNEDRMRERKIALGHVYEVYRSGDVTPHLGKLLKPDPNATPVNFPEHCPSCGSRLVKRGASYYCTNTWDCRDQIKASIAYAVSREALNIDGMAEKTVELLLEAELISRTVDLFSLGINDLMTLKNYTGYSATKLYLAIQDARATKFDRFILALGIPEVGKATARKFAQHLHLHQVLFELDTPEKVLELKIPEVGPSTAASIAAYFSHPVSKRDAMDLYTALDLPPEVGKITPIDGVTSKVFVFTGRFSESREFLENKVLAAGGRVATTVGQNTDYVVAGQEAGSKLRKAQILNIEVIDERVFLSLFA